MTSFIEAIEQIIEVPADTHDVLRIIAKDTSGLAPADRKKIRDAADELELVHQMLVSTESQLMWAQQHRMATNDRLAAAQAKLDRLSFYDPQVWRGRWFFQRTCPLFTVAYFP
jgi:hypothetical protein